MTIPHRKDNLFLFDYINSLSSNGKDPEFLEYEDKAILKSHSVFPGPGIRFVLDLVSGRYHYLSKTFSNGLQCHYSPLMEGGVEYFYPMISGEDVKIHGGFFENWFKLVSKVSPDQLDKYWFTSNFRVFTGEKKPLHILQHFIVNEVNSAGFPIMLTGVCLDINNYKTTNTIVNNVSTYDPEQGLACISEEFFYPESSLTKREMEICKLICEGLSAEEISEKLYISFHTVRTHRKNIYEKTNSKCVADLLGYIYSR